MIGELIGGAANVASTFAANAANLKIARENNETQLKIHSDDRNFNHQERLETQDWNRQQWLYEQQYNTPQAQAERLRAAGLNPAALMEGRSAQSTGSIASSSPASAPSSPSLSIPQMQAPDYSFLSNASLDNLLGTMSSYEDYKSKHINNEHLEENILADLEKKQGEIANLMQKTENDKLQHKLLSKQYESLGVQIEAARLQLSRDKLSSQYDEETIQLGLQKLRDEHEMHTESYKALQFANMINEKYGIQMADAQLANLMQNVRESKARIGLLLAQKNLTQQQAKTEIERTASATIDNIFKSKGYNLKDPKQLQSLKDDLAAMWQDEYMTSRAHGSKATMEYNFNTDMTNIYNKPIPRFIRGVSRFIGDNLSDMVPLLKAFK